MKKYILLLVLGLFSGLGLAQTALNSTTISEAVDLTEVDIRVGSVSNVEAGDLMVVDHETMLVRSISGTVLRVSRGYNGTKAAKHTTARLAFIDREARFYQNDLIGDCTATAEFPPFTPAININNGRRWTCTNSIWTEQIENFELGDGQARDAGLFFDGIQDFYIASDDSVDDLVFGSGTVVGTTPAFAIDENQLTTFTGALTTNGAVTFNETVELNTYRQDFDGPCIKLELADGTPEIVTDAGVNRATCDGGISSFVYRLDGAHASPFLVLGGVLDIDSDGANNEGVEILLSDVAVSTQGWSQVGTSPAMFVKASITIASVSGTDNFFFGWRLVESFVDNVVMATYDTYGTYHIDDNAGNVTIATGDDTVDASDEDDVIVAWVDAATHILEVRVSTAGVFTFFADGTASTISNATGAAAAGDIMVPVIAFLLDSDADAEIKINWIEVGEVL